MEPLNFKQLLSGARELVRSGKNLEAEMKLRSVIDDMRAQLGDESPLLAEAYEMRSFARVGLSNRARVKKAAWLDGACDDYERCIAILEKGAQNWHLSGSLTNCGSLFYRAERYDEALVFHEKALAVAEQLADPNGVERLAAWNQYAGTLIKLDRLDEAKKVLSLALSLVAADNPQRAFLLITQSEELVARAAKLHAEAESFGRRTCGRPSRPADVPVSADETCDEFRKLYCTVESGVMSVAPHEGGGKRLLVILADWALLLNLPRSYRGFELTFMPYIPEGTVIQGGGIGVDTTVPGPELRRQ